MKLITVFLLVCTFILLLLPHLLFAVARVIGWIFGFPVPYKGFGIASIVLVGVGVMLYVYGNRFGRFRSEVRQATITTRLPQSFHGYRIVHISDLHLDGWRGHEKALQKVVERINALHPDLICFTGDLISLSAAEVTPFVSILQHLSAADGVVSVLGNHDYLPYSRHLTPRERMEETARLVSMQRDTLGWQLLLNSHLLITRQTDTIAILGCENHSVGAHPVVKRGNLPAAMKDTEGLFRILLTHDPSQWRAEVVEKTDIPLTLSGHTHAMQFRLMGFTPSSLLYPECDGLYTAGSQSLYVNIGLGGTLPMRIGATPEVTLITLCNNGKENSAK